MHRFSVMLVISIIPSLFLSFLWQDPHNFLRVMAIAGCLLVLISFLLFNALSVSLFQVFRSDPPLIRILSFLSMSAFALKLILQCLTIFPVIGNAVFGDRPIIIGFLHMVFLVFVSLFLLAYFATENFLDIKNKFTRTALVVFATGVLFNELTLMTQGLGVMFIKGSYLFPWLLLGAAIWMFTGALLIGIARRKTNAEAIK